MIIINLTGGLGNQMFQYAFGLYLAHKHKTTLKYHYTNALLNTKRQFELDVFKITASPATSADLAAFGIPRNRVINRILYLLDDRYKIQLNAHVATQRFPYPFDAKLRDIPDNSYVQGYFADERYFKGAEDYVKEEFRLSKPLDARNQRIVTQMKQTESVSIHVRRTDYLTNPTNLPKFIGTDYYAKSIKDIKKKTKKPYYFIFSDDIAWCKVHFANLANTTFISHNTGINSYKDMILMSNCKYNIVANSTFSWWGRWLK